MAFSFTSRVRVGGSGFTVFTFDSVPLAFAQQVSHTSAQPVSAPVAIQPMDEPYPVQVITPAASGMGTMVLNLIELYKSKVWDRLGQNVGENGLISGNDAVQDSTDINNIPDSLAGAVDLVDIFIRIASRPNPIGMTKFIRPPKLGGNVATPYTEEFHNVVITNVVDGEDINVGTMEVIKQVTVAYTHTTRNGGHKSSAWALRNTPFLPGNAGLAPSLSA
jgi:hypothetical protein